MTLDQFYAYTPYETHLVGEAHAMKSRAAYQLAAWSAWHIEAFQRSKQLPKLNDVLQRMGGKPTERKSGAEILEAVRLMNVAAGGKVAKNG